MLRSFGERKTCTIAGGSIVEPFLFVRSTYMSCSNICPKLFFISSINPLIWRMLISSVTLKIGCAGSTVEFCCGCSTSMVIPPGNPSTSTQNGSPKTDVVSDKFSCWSVSRTKFCLSICIDWALMEESVVSGRMPNST